MGATAAACVAAPAWAGPTGGTVVGGQASITNLKQETLIKQLSGKAIINWNTYSVAPGQSVIYQQPGTSSIALNRVLGGNPSSILGHIGANGQVWLINPNGVLFGKGATVNAAGILATTADIANSDFMAGHYNFGTPSTNSNAGIVNFGTITAATGGSAVLAAPTVDNEGLIQARLGTVAVGAGKSFTVDFNGDNLLNFAVTSPATNAQIKNGGTLKADGGTVQITARAAGNVVDNVINTTGIVEANTVSIHNGTIVLDGGNGGVTVSGTLSAAGTASGTKGGTVQVSGASVNLGTTARIDVSGRNGGGTALIGGNFHGAGPQPNAVTTSIARGAVIDADAITAGNGGRVAVWSSKQTVFNGTITARGGAAGGNGGYVETSSAGNLVVGGFVDTLAPRGIAGDWLLDPTNVVVANSGGTIAPATIDVAASNVTLLANGGDVTFTDAVSLTNAGIGLSALAGNSIFVNAPIVTKGGALTLSANDPGESPTGNGFIQLNAALNTAGGNIAGGNVLLTLNGASGVANTISLGGNITTAGGTAIISGAAILTGNVAIDTTNAGAAPGGGTVIFGGTLDDASAYAHTLAIAAAGGDVDFNGRVGFNNPEAGGVAAGTPPGAVTITSANTVNLDIPLDAPNINGFSVGRFVIEGNGNANCVPNSTCTPGAGSLNAQTYISTLHSGGDGGPITIVTAGGVQVLDDIYAGGTVNQATGIGGNGGNVTIMAGGAVAVSTCSGCDLANFGTTGTGDQQLANASIISIFANGYATGTVTSAAPSQTAGNGGNIFVQGTSIDLPLGAYSDGGDAILGATAGAAGGKAGTSTLIATAGSVTVGAPENGNVVGVAAQGGNSVGGNAGAGAAVTISGSQLFLSHVYSRGGDTVQTTGGGNAGDITLTATIPIGEAVTFYGESDSPIGTAGQGTILAEGGKTGATAGSSPFFLSGGTDAGRGGNITIQGGPGGVPLNIFGLKLSDNSDNSGFNGGPTIFIDSEGGAGLGGNILINGPIGGTFGSEALRSLTNASQTIGAIGDKVPLGYISLFGGTRLTLSGTIITQLQSCDGCTPPTNQSGDVFLSGPVTLASDVTINTANGNTTGLGGTIEFGPTGVASPVNAAAPGAQSLTLETGDSGSAPVEFLAGSAVGASNPLGSLLIRGGGDIILQSVTTTGSQYYVSSGNGVAGTITLNGDLTAGSGNPNPTGLGSDIQFIGNVFANQPNLTLRTNGTISGGEIMATGPIGASGNGSLALLTLDAGKGLIVTDGTVLQNPTGATGCVLTNPCEKEGATQLITVAQNPAAIDVQALDQTKHILIDNQSGGQAELQIDNPSGLALAITPTLDPLSSAAPLLDLDVVQIAGTAGGIVLGGNIGVGNP
ncbi:MAG TPA: filamentous hemagglutinin N-terminal domain-containing protein, partial [Stellaceae bacterium]